MNSRGTLLGTGFVPNLVRLLFLLVILAFFFGSIISLWGTSYQWLAVVIGAFLLGTIVSLLFFRWKAIAFFTLGFLITNFTGAYIAHQQGDVSEARAAYVGVAGRDPAYAVLFPDPLNAWLAEFTPGSQGGNSISDRPDFDGNKRFVSRVESKKYDPSSVYYLATPDVDMTEKAFVESYRDIARQHGDWLGYMARCVNGGHASVPLLSQNRGALKEAERTGRSVCGAYTEEAFGIDIEETRETYLSRLGVSTCEESPACMRVKRELKSYGGTFFPE
ncbi:hypothetical protein [Henriciella marina]|uniref:DUF4105 domain-containing protein n=1 Tax=Henriciella marina TaxID=453851 RepID=A0ABT4LR99_9PROT|nr:hypothetical protein [Henriciella marina]MCZ4296878.1 hypothetical protein [Henriciella marina]